MQHWYWRWGLDLLPSPFDLEFAGQLSSQGEIHIGLNQEGRNILLINVVGIFACL